MKTGWTFSAILHAALLFAGVLSFGGSQFPDLAETGIVPIELVPVEDVSGIRLGSLDSVVTESDIPSVVDTGSDARIAEPTGNTEQDQLTPGETDKPTPMPTEQRSPRAQPVNIPDSPVQEAPVPPQPAAEPLPVDGPPVRATDPSDDPVAVQADDAEPEFVAPVPPSVTSRIERARVAYAETRKKQVEAAMDDAGTKSDITNRAESSGATTGSGGKKTAGSVSGRAARLTQSEKSQLAAQMRKCWSPPVSALEMDALVIRLLVDLAPDGSVSGKPKVIEISVPGKIGELTASAAQRAVRRCAPYSMPDEKYDEWRQVDVTFDPRDLR